MDAACYSTVKLVKEINIKNAVRRYIYTHPGGGHDFKNILLKLVPSFVHLNSSTERQSMDKDLAAARSKAAVMFVLLML